MKKKKKVVIGRAYNVLLNGVLEKVVVMEKSAKGYWVRKWRHHIGLATTFQASELFNT